MKGYGDGKHQKEYSQVSQFGGKSKDSKKSKESHGGEYKQVTKFGGSK
ncbi:MAG: hypothetical protein GY938_25825 [Ketobacter sp.]|nr:hypothetical protein [Ketobacter sp.]